MPKSKLTVSRPPSPYSRPSFLLTLVAASVKHDSDLVEAAYWAHHSLARSSPPEHVFGHFEDEDTEEEVDALVGEDEGTNPVEADRVAIKREDDDGDNDDDARSPSSSSSSSSDTPGMDSDHGTDSDADSTGPPSPEGPDDDCVMVVGADGDGEDDLGSGEEGMKVDIKTYEKFFLEDKDVTHPLALQSARLPLYTLPTWTFEEFSRRFTYRLYSSSWECNICRHSKLHSGGDYFLENPNRNPSGFYKVERVERGETGDKDFKDVQSRAIQHVQGANCVRNRSRLLR